MDSVKYNNMEGKETINRGLISSIFTKGNKDDVRNYREVTQMDMAYEIYANQDTW